MKELNYKAVILDMDGTILDTITDIAVSVNYALEKNGFPLHNISEYKTFIGNGARNLVLAALPQDKRDDGTLEKVLKDYSEYYATHSSVFTEPYPKIKETLLELRGAGVKLAVFSNKPHKATQKLAELYFDGIFDAVYGARDGYPIKPDPSVIFEIAEEFGVSADECAYIGDMCVDMKTGKSSGAYTIGAEWGFGDKEGLLENGADVTLGSISEIRDIVIKG